MGRETCTQDSWRVPVSPVQTISAGPHPIRLRYDVLRVVCETEGEVTDNLLTRDEAIEAMRKGEKCETLINFGCSGPWAATRWEHFDSSFLQFRKPPEPRRDAMLYWLYEGHVFLHKPHDKALRVREVLPGDVTLQRMTEAEAKEQFDKQCEDKVFLDANLRRMCMGYWIASRRALGLIGEGS